MKLETHYREQIRRYLGQRNAGPAFARDHLRHCLKTWIGALKGRPLPPPPIYRSKY